MASKKLFYPLDAIRGVLAIFVMFRHNAVFIDPYFPQLTYMAVDVFFLLSGIVICQNYESKLIAKEMSNRTFMTIRLLRIWPLYMLGSLIGLAALVLGSDGEFHVFQGLTYLALAIFLVPNPLLFGGDIYPLNGPAWSLILELVANAFYGSFVRHLSTARLITIVIVSASGVIGVSFAGPQYNIDVGNHLKTLHVGLFRVGFSFFLGVLLYRAYSNQKLAHLTGAAANAASILIIAVISIILLLSPSITSERYVDLICVGVLFPFLIYILLHCDMTGTPARVARFLGLTSYAVYAIHAPLGHLLQDINGHLPADVIGRAAPWGGALLVIFVLGLSYILDRYYDTPVRRALAGPLGVRRARDAVPALPV